ncbi:MAG: hypothetical protein N5P05_004142 (plasmid) [Chroococcopsis gigantea SAG 12.99]|jgi:hypothetical protein|nr:hypothetical protein [Chroococcopsis gigantea SAG 12.99]
MFAQKWKNINILIYLIYLLSPADKANAQAYRDDSVADLDRLFNVMGLADGLTNEFVDNKKYFCNQVTEFTYQSPKLISANKEIAAYFEATWKRRPQRASDGIECGGIAQTTKATMLIERGGKTRRIAVEIPHQSDDGGEFIIYKPISFSRNLDYILFRRTHVAAELEDEYIAFNFEKNRGIYVATDCNAPFQIYRGLSTSGKVYFTCHELDSSGNSRDYLTSFNPNDQSTKRWPDNTNFQLYSYGSLEGNFILVEQ